MKMRKLKLHIPQIEELAFKQKMLSNPKTMAYNHAYGGTISFGEERWRAWHQKWIGNNDRHYFYRYLINENNNFVGEIAYHYEQEEDKYFADVLIDDAFRQRGYGLEGLEILCEQAKINGIEILYDDIATDNSSIYLFKKLGFKITEQTDNYIRVCKKLF